MNHKTLTLAIAAVLATPLTAVAADAAPTPEHSFSYNVGVTSNYIFRGISQTHGKPALQGGVDYAHSSGLYAGVWASNITWVKQYLDSGSTEIDVYGGFKNSFADDWTYDVGLIHYHYAGSGSSTRNNAAVFSRLADPNTTEVYGAIGWKWLTLKYSHAISENFIGWVPINRAGYLPNKESNGSNYLELNAAYDLGDGWGISGHIGHQKVKNVGQGPAGLNDADYTDWNIGVTKDVGFGVVGLLYSDTDTNGSCKSATGGTNAYCWGKNMNSTTGGQHNFRDESKGQLVLSFKKTF
jgi:uncharacterized protein (TIGR02001 family)